MESLESGKILVKEDEGKKSLRLSELFGISNIMLKKRGCFEDFGF